MKEKKKSQPVLPSQKTNPLLLYHKTAKAFNPKQELFAEPSRVRRKAQTDRLARARHRAHDATIKRLDLLAKKQVEPFADFIHFLR